MRGAANERSKTLDEPRASDLEEMDKRRARHFLAEPMSDPSAEDEADYEERIRRLELEARPLDPSAEERVRLRDKVVAYAESFLEGIGGRPAFVTPEAEDSALYDSPISEGPTDPDEALDLLTVA
jgi:hypothetical protein